MATEVVDQARYTVPPSQEAMPTRSIRVRDEDWKRFRRAALAADQTVARFLVTLLDEHESRTA